jgi:hypothetical protein
VVATSTSLLRVRHRVLQTPVVRYEHEETGRTVTLIATVHAAEAAYYKRLHAIITRLEAAGAVVHYEMVTPATQQEWATATDAERAVRHVTTDMATRGVEALCRYFGWVWQGTAMTLSPSWHNVDMTDLEFVRRAGPGSLAQHQETGDDLFHTLTQEQKDVVLGTAASVLFRLMSYDRFGLYERGLLWSGPGHAVLDERNRNALDRVPADSDVVLVWGAGHLRGLGAGLEAAGYRQRRVVWLNAATLPTLWATARTAWTAVNSRFTRAPESADDHTPASPLRSGHE